jgi:molybdate transport system ATP-binding protein
MTAARPPALDARLALTVGAGDRAFRLEVELTLDAGVLVLFGPSGAGKSLTLQALTGLLPGVRGHVRVGGEVLVDSARGVDVPAERRRFGYVPQQHALFPFLDVAGNVAFGLPRRERTAGRVLPLLDELGLDAEGASAGAHGDGEPGVEGERARLAHGASGRGERRAATTTTRTDSAERTAT